MTAAARTTEQPPLLQRGETAPWFRAPALSGADNYSFDTVAGRHVLMLFFEQAAKPAAAEALRLVAHNRALFDDLNACFFGVTCDPSDAAEGRIAQQLPGIRFFLDYQRAVSAAYRAAGPKGYRAHWLLLDPRLRVLGSFPIANGRHALEALRAALANPSPAEIAPVLVVPNVIPDKLCTRLIGLYERDGGEESGYMREVEGKTVLVVNPAHKQRRDYLIEDEALRDKLRDLIRANLTVPVQRAFQFRATRIERYIVACYEAGAGHFRPHRDNTTKGTAHRKFAVTINLNAGDYDGGDLRFPEFGDRTYRAPTGGAVVFSCSLLHEATPVTQGKRYAFLPFLYDEDGARLREANNAHLGEGVDAYRA